MCILRSLRWCALISLVLVDGQIITGEASVASESKATVIDAQSSSCDRHRGSPWRCPFGCVCNETEAFVNCNSGYHKSIPFLPRDAMTVKFQGVRVVNDHAFISAPCIESITIGQGLVSIEQEAFYGLKHLEILSIQGSHLSTFPPGIFKGMLSLKELSVMESRFTDIPNIALYYLINLERLRLHQNRFTRYEFGECFLALRKLSSIALDENKLKSGQLDDNVFKNLRFTNLKKMTLRLCNIHHISVGTFRFLPHLETLVLTGNFLSNVPALALLSLTKLQSLFLGENHLTGVNFQNISFINLTTLVINENNITIIRDDSFSSIKMCPMRSLSCASCAIQIITLQSMKGFHLLEYLDLFNNKIDQQSVNNLLIGLQDSRKTMKHLRIGLRISTIDDATFRIAQLKQLEVLHISGFVRSLKRDAFKYFPKLKELRLERCKLVYIEDGAFNINVNLRVISVIKSHITRIPEIKHDNLKELHLIANNIDNLYNSPFQFLRNLETLNLARNDLTNGNVNENSFVGLTNLLTLDLSKNRLQRALHINVSPFSPLHSIQKIILYNNNLGPLDRYIFHGLSTLKTLHLEGNYRLFENLNPNIFQNLTSLEYLGLDNCGMQYIPLTLFRDQVNLRELYLGRNMISHLHTDAFKSLGKVTIIRLDNNKISTINETSLNGLINLQRLDLSFNPFECSCHLLWFCKWLKKTKVNILFYQYSKNITAKSKYACNSPAAKHGLSVFDFDISEEDCVDDIVLSVIKFLCGVFIAIIAIVCVVIRYRWYIRYGIYVFRLKARRYTETARNDDFVYDAFVCYHENSLEWVIHNLLPNVEYKAGFKLCLHHRDWLPGIDITDNIVDSIEKSRKAILILTNDFARSRWCQLEAALAQHAHLNENRDVLVIVMLEPIKVENLNARLHSLIITKTHIQWTHNERGQILFWKRLRRSLLKPTMRGRI